MDCLDASYIIACVDTFRQTLCIAEFTTIAYLCITVLGDATVRLKGLKQADLRQLLLLLLLLLPEVSSAVYAAT